MDPKTLHVSLERVLDLAARQHGVVARAQLLDLGVSSDAIAHRLRRGRLHSVRRGIYAVGRPQLTRHGALLAAVLACGENAALSHASAAELWEIRRRRPGAIEVTVPTAVARRPPGIVVHRRALAAAELTQRHGIPVTSPICTLLDLATRLRPAELEAAVNEADKLDLVDPERVRSGLDRLRGRRGAPALRQLLDRRTFTLTDSELERRFLPLAASAGLDQPLTRQLVNGFRVDFYWPDLGLVVETDGLRYHRTPAQQTRDRLRDQAHTAAGLTPLRFTHAQVAFEPAYVRSVLIAVAQRARPRGAPADIRAA